MITQRLGFVSGASAAPVLRATDELAKMMFRMRARVMKNAEMSEKLGRSKLVESVIRHADSEGVAICYL
jgi:hypothetical protein